MEPTNFKVIANSRISAKLWQGIVLMVIIMVGIFISMATAKPGTLNVKASVRSVSPL